MSTHRALASALLDPAAPCPPGLRTWNGSDPARRLAVYRNNVISGLVDVLAHSFPVVQQLVGSACFRSMASVFVRQHPPHSALMAQFGAGFAAFIAAFAPAAGLPQALSLPQLCDVARLEWARLQALHAADAPPMSAAALASALAEPAALPGLRLVLHASVAVVASPHAVVSLWAAHQAADSPPLPCTPQPEQALVLRDGLEVLVIPVSPATAVFVGSALAGDAFGAAAAAASALDAGFDLAATLALLLRHSVLLALQDLTQDARQHAEHASAPPDATLDATFDATFDAPATGQSCTQASTSQPRCACRRWSPGAEGSG